MAFANCLESEQLHSLAGQGRSGFQRGTTTHVLPAALLGLRVLQLEHLHSAFVGKRKFQGTQPHVQTPPRVFRASSKQTNNQEPNSAHLF